MPALYFWRSRVLLGEFQAVITEPVVSHFGFLCLRAILLEHKIISQQIMSRVLRA